MDYEKIKKIPLFKNRDFSDPKERREFWMLVAAVVMIAIVGIAAALSNKNKPEYELLQEDTTKQQDRTSASLLVIPEGEDRDVLDETSMLALRERERRRNRGEGSLRDLYITNEGDDDANVDPMAGTDKTEYEIEQEESQKRDDAIQSRLKSFGLGHDDETVSTKEEQRGDYGDRYRESGRKEVMGAAVYNPSVTQAQPPVSTAGYDDGRSHEPDDIPVSDTPESPVEQAPAPAKVRKTGGISSLDEWGTIDGIGGLDNEDQYVVMDAGKPVRVMFVKDQKISSGDKVTLRLLDDIAAEGILIPKNTHLSAQCQIGERLRLTVNNIEINGKILSLGYTAFDNDGNEGLYYPETEKKKKKDQASQAGKSLGTQVLSSLMGGGVAMSMVNEGTSIIRSESTALISSGYTFYLLKDEY